jgi:hypothetical protein
MTAAATTAAIAMARTCVDVDESAKNTTSSVVTIEGLIVRKKKRGQGWLVVNILDERISNVSTSVWIQTRRQENKPTDIFCIQAIVQVTAILQKLENDDDDDGGATTTKWIAQSWNLTQCAPNLEAILVVWKGITRGIYSPWTLLMSDEEYDKLDPKERQPTGPPPIPPTTILENIQNHRQVATNDSKMSRKGPRKRSPHVRRRDIRLLDHFERVGSPSELQEQQPQQPTKWKLYKPQYVPMEDALDNPYCQSTDISASNLDSHSQRRLDYMEGKKHPQISWMIQRLFQIMGDFAPKHILDVGGGRGDLAVALVIAFPHSRITIVDKNTTSLLAGEDYAIEVLGKDDCERRLRFVDADFGELMMKSPPNTTNNDDFSLATVDWVVALHACGDLSDLALQCAREYSCSFLLCPCCYTKRYCFTKDRPPPWTHYISTKQHVESDEVDGDGGDDPSATLGRLAELSEAPDISKRAMTIVNSMRLADCESKEEKQETGRDYAILRLEEYNSQCSGRNIVLVGAS